MNSTFREQSSCQNLSDAVKKELTPMATHAYTTDTVSPTSSSYQATFPKSSHDHSSSTVAISSTGNHILAESLKGKAAGEAFQKYRDDLRIAVTDPHILASSLYSNSIISRETLDRVELQTLTCAEKNMAMFDAIEARIKTNPSSFVTLLGILNSDSQLQIFAGHLQQCYGKCYSLE